MSTCRRTVCRNNFNFEWDRKLRQHPGRFAHNRQISVRTHDNAHQRSFSRPVAFAQHAPPLLGMAVSSLANLNRISLRNSPARNHAAEYAPAVLERLPQSHLNFVQVMTRLAWERYFEYGATHRQPLSRPQLRQIQARGRDVFSHDAGHQPEFGKGLTVNDQYLPLTSLSTVCASLESLIR